ncbi:MAG: histidine kinase [Clostridia bacterium]|nr:histidine kinase [Clostridia bacterium]
MFTLFFELANRVGFLIMISFVFSRTKPFKHIFVTNIKLKFTDQLIMACVFGGLGILGTYTGIDFKGAIVNTRVIGVVVGGLIGGPIVGMLSGFIAGLHRYLIDPLGPTSISCAISTLVEGTLAGYLSISFVKSKNPILFAWVTGTVAEFLQMVIIIIVARPYAYATNLVSIIGMPMIIMNAIGISVFIAIVDNIKKLQDSEAALRAQQTLKIADETLQYFRRGLKEGVKQVTEIIYQMTDFKAVVITDHERILGNAGILEAYNREGFPIETDMTRHVLETGHYLISQNTQGVNCLYKNLALNSAIIVPLKLKNKTVGTLKLYKSEVNGISIVDEELARGLGKLFSTQLELSQIEKEANLRTKAEIQALQAQINPHFLFNAINTIVSLIRTSPQDARNLLIHLGDYFRNNLQTTQAFINIKDELKHVETYLEIEKARFGDKLNVTYDLPDEMDFQIPPLMLQPIVENAVKHGIFPKADQGNVHIRIYFDEQFSWIQVEDDGVGMDMSKWREGFGLENVKKRLKAIYGDQHYFEIVSEPSQGTSVKIGLPREVRL